MKKNIKLNQKGIAHHLLLIVLAVLVVGAVGFAGYRIYSNKKLDAQAAGYSSYSNKGWKLNVCKIERGSRIRFRYYVSNSTAIKNTVFHIINDDNVVIAYGRKFTVAPRSNSTLKDTGYWPKDNVKQLLLTASNTTTIWANTNTMKYC